MTGGVLKKHDECCAALWFEQRRWQVWMWARLGSRVTYKEPPNTARNPHCRRALSFLFFVYLGRPPDLASLGASFDALPAAEAGGIEERP